MALYLFLPQSGNKVKNEVYFKNQVLATKRTLDLILKHPEGATGKTFKEAGVPIFGIERLMKLGIVVGKQVKEPERGKKAYHWIWFPASAYWESKK